MNHQPYPKSPESKPPAKNRETPPPSEFIPAAKPESPRFPPAVSKLREKANEGVQGA